jgi:hypothetical protein
MRYALAVSERALPVIRSALKSSYGRVRVRRADLDPPRREEAREGWLNTVLADAITFVGGLDRSISANRRAGRGRTRRRR